MYFFLVVVLLVSGLDGDELTNGQCDKKGGCDSQTTGKPVMFQHTDDAVNHYPPLNDKFYLIPDGHIPRVLWWHDHIYPHQEYLKEITCPLGKCAISKDRATLHDILTRGIIFYGTSIEKEDWPLPRLPQHEWALFHEESPKNNWMLSTEIGISLFNHTATFKRESDYPLSTQFLRDPDNFFDTTYFVETKDKNRFQRDEGLAPLVYVQRDCNPPSDRDTYVKELMKYIKVDSYGECLNNKKMPENLDGFHKLSNEEYYHFLAKYKFQIAFENAICPDYMTEKIFRPMQIGSVPIYLGSERIRDFMPSLHSVIVATDFGSPKLLAEYLLELNSNDDKYDEYLAHRKTNKITNPEFQKSIDRQPWKLSKWQMPNFGHFMFAQYSCHICDRLHERDNRLNAHLQDNSKPLLPIKYGKQDHLGCPLGRPIFGDGETPHYHAEYIAEIQDAPKGVVKMLLANETDSSVWKKYL